MNQLDYYVRNQAEIVKKYNGKIIGVKDGEVQGEFATKTEALEFMVARFEPGSFIVIKCTPGDEQYTRRYRSRVLIPVTAC